MASLTIGGATALVGSNLEVRADVSIGIVDGRISEIAPSGTGSKLGEQYDARGMTLLPGFIDAHVHIGFYEPSAVLERGVTTVRDLGWPEREIHELARRSRVAGFAGPEIVPVGPILTAPGGYPTRAEWAPPGTGREVVGPDDARAAVAARAERGASAIKIALNPPVGPTFDASTLAAIAGAAHDRGLKVTGHIHGLDELDKAIDAGVDELAHMLMGDFVIPDATIARMVAAGMVVVPTLSCRFGRERDTAIDNLARFRRAGGTVVYGTDLGNEGPEPGIDAREVDAMEAAGMSVGDIVRSATVGAARWLGLDDRGCIEVGCRADIVALRNAPRRARDLTHVAAVWRGGELIG